MNPLLLLLSCCTVLPAENDFKNLQLFPRDIAAEDLRRTMNTWAVDLGARCSFCHWGPTDEFDDLVYESDAKDTKKTAREMFSMMTKINDTFFRHRETKISCYTCHHGTADPRRLDDILAEALTDGGVARVDETYREIREEYYGQGAYNFGAWTSLFPLAQQLERQKQHEAAKALHELNLEFNPGYDGSHFALGAFHLLVLPDPDQARFHFQKAMDGNSFWTPRRLLALAQRLRQGGELGQCSSALHILIDIAPTNAEAHFQLGRLLQETGRPSEARASYEKALAHKPDHEGASRAIATLDRQEE